MITWGKWLQWKLFPIPPIADSVSDNHFIKVQSSQLANHWNNWRILWDLLGGVYCPSLSSSWMRESRLSKWIEQNRTSFWKTKQIPFISWPHVLELQVHVSSNSESARPSWNTSGSLFSLICQKEEEELGRDFHSYFLRHRGCLCSYTQQKIT